MTTKLNAGVVTGAQYKTLVQSAKDNHYALAAVNCTSTHTINAALEAAGKTKTDIIIQMSNGGAEFFAGASSRALELASFAPSWTT